jgi:hypothetical protein
MSAPRASSRWSKKEGGIANKASFSIASPSRIETALGLNHITICIEVFAVLHDSHKCVYRSVNGTLSRVCV